MRDFLPESRDLSLPSNTKLPFVFDGAGIVVVNLVIGAAAGCVAISCNICRASGVDGGGDSTDRAHPRSRNIVESTSAANLCDCGTRH